MAYKLTVNNQTVNSGGQAAMLNAALDEVDNQLGTHSGDVRSMARAKIIAKSETTVNGATIKVEKSQK